MHKFAAASLMLAFVLSSGRSAAAQGEGVGDCQAPTGPGVARPASSLVIENDAAIGADQDYTNGVGLIYSVPEGTCAPLDGVATALNDVLDVGLFDAIPGLGLSGVEPQGHLTMGLAHQIYTPSDLSRPDPDPADRPYAAWAYYSVAYIRERREDKPVLGREGAGARSALSITQLDIGAVGPMVQGEWLQRGFHDLINAEVDPQGWSHQIDNEPGVVIRHERMIASRWDTGPLDLELSWNVGASVGNVMTDVGTGVGFRIGYNIDVDYGPPRLRPGLSAPNHFERGEDGPFSIYLLGGAGGRAVARNIFLDGNTFGDGPSVPSKTWVGDYQLGAAVVLGWAKIAVTRVWRTDEFVGQGRHSAFDSMVISWRY
jgi:hypothetical protein